MPILTSLMPSVGQRARAMLTTGFNRYTSQAAKPLHDEQVNLHNVFTVFFSSPFMIPEIEIDHISPFYK